MQARAKLGNRFWNCKLEIEINTGYVAILNQAICTASLYLVRLRQFEINPQINLLTTGGADLHLKNAGIRDDGA